MAYSLFPFKGVWPQIADDVFLAEGARICGDVRIGESSGVWFNAVIRGDEAAIQIGRFTNIQDNAVVHANSSVGDYVTVGHQALLHGCRIGNNCIIGMNSVLMDGVEIGENSIVGAGALITLNKSFAANSLIVGSPARAIRRLEPAEIEKIRQSALHYQQQAAEYLRYLHTIAIK
ncbi:MAG: gamma carbonic anhydrase family protein [Sporomusaceae bacterium]|nr:gamma carbonic anhydrase family protein [Sporomusaceae bacterium]